MGRFGEVVLSSVLSSKIASRVNVGVANTPDSFQGATVPHSGASVSRRFPRTGLRSRHTWKSLQPACSDRNQRGEHGDGEGATAEQVLRDAVGDWVLEEQPGDLGRAEARDGSAGRGAEAWIPVVQWAADVVANNVVDITIGYALARILGRLRERKQERKAEGGFLTVEVSRGVAAGLAAADVAEHFDEPGPLEVEAVEEPSAIAGHEVTELSYTGLEPWIVLLRNMEAEVRYLVVVLPDGRIVGRLRVPFLEHEAGFLPPSRFIAE